MKAPSLILCFILSWYAAAAAEETFDLTAMDAIPPERLVLVTYRDRNIGRVPVAGHYRRRGPYRGSTWSARTAHRLAEDYRLTQIAQWPVTELGEHCVVYALPEDRDTTEVLRALATDGRVVSAQTMRVFQTHAVEHQDPLFQLQENLQWMDIDAAHRLARGQRVHIAVIDTNIDVNHPDLHPRIGLQQRFLDHPDEAEIHGTAMAGIIAAQADNRTGIVGVAPGARLLALQACWSGHPRTLAARCNTFSLALALNTAIRLHPRIINLSLTGPEDPLLRRLIQRAIEQGIVVVAAEPDDGREENFPASMDHVIAVQSLENRVADLFAQERCVPAPGREILTTFPGGEYNFISGSSAATAQVSGIIALMLELRPELDVDEIRRILHQAVERRRGRKVINAYAAVQAAARAIH